MENVSGRIRSLIKEAVNSFGVESDSISFSLEQPEDSSHGDLATNVAFSISKTLNISPKETAEKILQYIENNKGSLIDKVEIAGPGFINFFLTKEAVRESIKSVEGHSIINTKYTNKKVLVEHSSPNLFKPFTVGHLMNNITGEAVVEMMKATGANVSVMAFPSDISLGIAKAIYIIKKEKEVFNLVLQKSQEEIVVYLGDCYVNGVAHYEKFPDCQNDVKDIAQRLYDSTPSEELEIFQIAKKFNMEYFVSLMESLGSNFDNFLFESQAGVIGKAIVLENTPAVFTKSEGAIVYIPEENRKDINLTVFINSQGNPTYEAKDLGLLSYKFEKFNPDFSFFVTDSEQIPHFKVVLTSAGKINSKWKEMSFHIPHGRMSFKGKKMSSRLGGVPMAVKVLEEVMEEVKSIGSEKLKGLSDGEKEKVYKEVSLAALKFSILRSKLGSNINFDPETSLSFEGDSGPYVQYTYARTKSLLGKGKEAGFNPLYDDSQEVTMLERKLIHFKDMTVRAIEEIAPQKIVIYLFELSQIFNNFYANNQIIVEGDNATSHRLAIVESVSKVIKQSLKMLGVDAPEKM